MKILTNYHYYYSNILLFYYSFKTFFSQIRLSQNITDDVDEDPTGNKALWDRGLLNGASQKADFIANFHIGEVCMSLQVNSTVFPLNYIVVSVSDYVLSDT